MPTADAAPDPPDRPAAALAAALMAWCATKSPPDAGAWLPALPFGEWFDWQQDLARRLAAAALAAGREQPDAGGATMTAEDLSEAVIRHLQDAGCVIIPDAADDLTPVLAAAVREADAAAAARQREADAALVVQLGKNPGFWDSWPERVAAEILAGGGGAGGA
jgi:hypothetical protein